MIKSYGGREYPVAYRFDSQGRQTHMTNWTAFPSTGAHVTTWTNNPHRGWLDSKRYPDSTGLDYTYTAAGRNKTRLSARGITTTYTNNLAGDLVGIGYSDGTTSNLVFTLDRLGRPITIVQGTNTTTLAYTDSGQLLSESLNGLAVTNDYDSLLRRLAVAYSGDAATLVKYGYDAASRLAGATNGTYSAAYSYVANSPLVGQIAFKSNTVTRMTTTRQHDLLNRLSSIESSATVSAVSAFGYRYNPANQRTYRHDRDGAFWKYNYDLLGQVTSGQHYWDDWTPVAGQQFEYVFDDIGNRTSTKAGGTSSGAGLRTASYSVNSLNQYTSRDVPDAVDIIGVSHVQSTNTVNDQSPYRRGEYFHKELSINNASAAVYQGVTNLAWLSGVTNTNTGNIFLPETSFASRIVVSVANASHAKQRSTSSH